MTTTTTTTILTSLQQREEEEGGEEEEVKVNTTNASTLSVCQQPWPIRTKHSQRTQPLQRETPRCGRTNRYNNKAECSAHQDAKTEKAEGEGTKQEPHSRHKAVKRKLMRRRLLQPYRLLSAHRKATSNESTRAAAARQRSRRPSRMPLHRSSRRRAQNTQCSPTAGCRTQES